MHVFWGSKRARGVIVLTALCALWSAEASAQSVCSNRGADAFSAARRARRALEDFDQVNRAFESDLNLLSRADEAYRLKHPVNWRLYAGPSADVALLPTLPLCNNNGPDPNGDLVTSRVGIVAGADELTWGLSLRYVFSQYSLGVSGRAPSMLRQGETESQQEFERREYSASTGQTTHAVRVQGTRWFALTVGTILYEPVSTKAAADGTRLDGVQATSDGSDHLFFRAEVPAAGVSFDLVLGDEREEVETLYLDVNRLRLGSLPVEVSARVAYLDDEKRAYSVLGANWVRDYRRPDATIDIANEFGIVNRQYQKSGAVFRVGGDVATEYSGFNLRYAQAHMSMGYTQFTSHADDVSAMIMGGVYVDAEVSWYAGVYGGQFMREELGEDWAFGTGGRVSTGIGFRLMSIYFDAFTGFNKPETLSRMVQAKDAPEAGIQLRWRVGF